MTDAYREEIYKLIELWCKTPERKTYPIGNKGDEVVPEDVQNQKQGHQKVENVINREHLNKLGRQKRIEVKIFKQSEKTWAASEVVEYMIQVGKIPIRE